jgi:hypothetical protein
MSKSMELVRISRHIRLDPLKLRQLNKEYDVSGTWRLRGLLEGKECKSRLHGW